MLQEEISSFQIEPHHRQRLREIAKRVLDVIEEWKSKQAQRMSAQGMTSDEMFHQLKRYIRSQRGGKMLIGKITALDHSQQRERTYNVLLSDSENQGGYFDDEYSAYEMLEIKHTAIKSGELYACRKYRVGIETVRRAMRIPEDIIQSVPARYMGRGEIVLTLNYIRKAMPLSRIVDLLTHEFTHAVQPSKEWSPSYGAISMKIHRGEHLTPEELVAYYTEPAEYEAQLVGVTEHIKMEWDNLSDPTTVTSVYTEADIFKMTGLLGEDGVDAVIERNKKRYIEKLENIFLNTDIESCQYTHQHKDELNERAKKLLELCETRKFMHADACAEYRKLKAAYPFVNTYYGEFVCAVSMSPEHWYHLKSSLSHTINAFKNK